MNLLGVDVGFSAKRKTTGIAILRGDQLATSRTTRDSTERLAALPPGFRASVIALDGPLLPNATELRHLRLCETVFARSPFHKRCKPGFSHFGCGLELRKATQEAYTEFARTLLPMNTETDSTCLKGPVVEAFPNAFLGVLVDDLDFRTIPKLRRGHRFDWLYDRVAASGKLEEALSRLIPLPVTVWRQLREETDHELRAALICLLTAAIAAVGEATVVGEDFGGWFWLPPRAAWQPWALEGLNKATKRVEMEGTRVNVMRGIRGGDSTPGDSLFAS